MRAAVIAHPTSADAVVMAAAVADFRPKEAATAGKLKKDDGAPELVLEPTPDILRELGERAQPARTWSGFAAETADVEAHGRAKLVRKGADLLVANEVGRDGTGLRLRDEPCGDPRSPTATTSRCATGPSASSPAPSSTGSKPPWARRRDR